ncbi:MAG: flagellar hook capping FlgD N-terminal domain-containing protein [Pseudomonadota bacterium]
MSDPITLVPNQVVNTSQSGQIFSQADEDTSQLAQDFDDFLQLLTTQLQNQDPLDPTDTETFTDQITQFNQVEQQIGTNAKLDQLIAATQGSSLQQALGYVGLDVSYEGQEFFSNGDGSINRFIYDLSDEVEGLTLRVVNEDGDTVYTEKASSLPGLNIIEWDGVGDDGTVQPSGNYTIQLDVVPIDPTEPVSVELGVSSRVTGVETRSGEIFLAMGDVVIPLAQVFSAELPTLASAITGDGSSAGTGDGSGDDTTSGGGA